MDSPFATARFRLDEAHDRLVWRTVPDGLARQRRWWWLGWGLVAVGFAVAVAVFSAGIVSVAIGAYLLSTREQARSQFLAARRGQAGHGAMVDVAFDEAGITARTPRFELVAPWGVYVEDHGDVLEIPGPDDSVLYLPWAHVEPPSAVEALKARMATTLRQDGRATMEQTPFDERSRLVFGVAHGVVGEGARLVLAAVLCDPETADELQGEGFDLEALEHAATGKAIGPPSGQESVWQAPAAVVSSDAASSFGECLPTVLHRPWDMADILLAARAMPELRQAWKVARGGAPAQPERGAIRVFNDDTTKMEFVVAQLVAHAGCTPITATRTMLRVHDAGSAILPVAQPEAVVQAIREAARQADAPLRLEVEV